MERGELLKQNVCFLEIHKKLIPLLKSSWMRQSVREEFFGMWKLPTSSYLSFRLLKLEIKIYPDAFIWFGAANFLSELKCQICGRCCCDWISVMPIYDVAKFASDGKLRKKATYLFLRAMCNINPPPPFMLWSFTVINSWYRFYRSINTCKLCLNYLWTNKHCAFWGGYRCHHDDWWWWWWWWWCWWWSEAGG